MGQVLTVGPNEALIISGSTTRKKKKEIIIGGYKWVWTCVQHYTYIPLSLITAFAQCVGVETKLGVALTVSGVAQVRTQCHFPRSSFYNKFLAILKVKIDRELVEIAAEQFGGRKIRDIRDAVSETMEGHLRAILGTLTVEEVLQERITFAEKVKEIAEPDLELMGMKIVSFTIRDIQDDGGYLKALGRTRIAEVKRDADIATAENNKIAGIREVGDFEAGAAQMPLARERIHLIRTQAQKSSFVHETVVCTTCGMDQLAKICARSLIMPKISEVSNDWGGGQRLGVLPYTHFQAECEREAMDLIYQSQARTSENSKEAAMRISAYTAEIETAKAQAEMAYSLEEAILKQRIREEEKQIEVTETKKRIEIEELEIERAELELMTNVRLPADAESYRLEKISEGEKVQTVESATASSARIQLIGDAEANSMKNVGNAEAMHRELRARAFKKYNPAATASLVIEAMPLITSHVAKPLGKVDDIVIMGGSDKLTGDVARLAAQVPPAVHAVAGSQMSDLLRKGLHLIQKKKQENITTL